MEGYWPVQGRVQENGSLMKRRNRLSARVLLETERCRAGGVGCVCTGAGEVKEKGAFSYAAEAISHVEVSGYMRQLV
jgi:hypothetical protein